MNLLARYNMLRTAVIAMIGVTDDVDTLKKMAQVLRVPALTDADAAASLLVLQTLITTHGSTPPSEQTDPRVAIAIDYITDARRVWMEENPCEEGRDHVTPFDFLLYGVPQ